ncbi:hypothetical protein Gasu2_42330 [Galdieria sulphuraria]|uniref:Uncharacterized protein n=1 Tax=Galdieria sulphuraria TaxID=130081 RepID=M2WRN9_GALSU|nr:uncharacterized protein Gasu_58880 [Galdieria sulphuraria]EME26485.1 hypothetical protein Gasu_58880 [Galdieria sulphuraria]GJD10013.1 hypothetical protein Gasu2_42330 [Galdieria sulphuraria]|eukprot:XP_005703005.1 hypothetical protein Gasu_58880 [Galdieria sulphuraria]
MSDPTTSSHREAVDSTNSPSSFSRLACSLSWKRLYFIYQRNILPEYQKPILYTLLGILFLSLWRLVFKIPPLDLFHWLDVEYFLQNEDGTPYGYVYFPLGTILLFIGVVTIFTRVTNRLQSRYSFASSRTS